MNNTTALAFLGFLLTIGSNQAKAAQDPGAPARRPNVLFLAVDDLRPALGCYGDPHAKTPNMDRLAASGMRFDRAYCQVAVCNPSRASLMTGQRPDRLGVWTLPVHFREAQPHAVTMPQWFRKHGYTAVSHGKIYHNPTPDPQSWSEPIRPRPDLPDAYPEGTNELVKEARSKLPARDWRKSNLRRPSTAAPDLPDEQLLDGAQTQMAIEDLRRLGTGEQPFFLAMGYIRPHLAFVAPKKYWDLYDPETLPVPASVLPNEGAPEYALHNNSELSHYVDMVDVPAPWEDGRVSPEKARQLVHGYYACVSYVDAQIGLILDALESEGLADNTCVVLWSDHGWKLGEYGGWGKMTNYEIDTRVPLILRSPGMEHAGEGSDQLVELLDLLPTLCDLSGIPIPDFADGTSLVPVLEDPGAPIRPFASSQYYRRHKGEEVMGYTIRTPRYRLVEWREFATGKPILSELYDQDADPLEVHNLIAKAEPTIVEELTALLVNAHPRQGLSLTPAIHSTAGSSRTPAELILTNNTPSLIKAYRITERGKRGRATGIEPGATVHVPSTLGSVFVIESADGTLHEVHSPSLPARAVVLN